MPLTISELEEKSLNIRKKLLKLCNKESIHIGGDLSVTDLMVVLWEYQLKFDPKNPKAESNDRFVLSKSHASAVLDLVQADIGCFIFDDVYNNYAKDGSMFSMHSCSLANPYVNVSTGSLGHGFPVACGIAQGLKLKNSKSKVYVIMGDGEQAEGSIWEAAMNAAKLKLDNLIAIIDSNNYGADGSLEKYSCVNNLKEKYISFNWNVYEINGNNISELVNTFDLINSKNTSMPTIIISKTTKGKGIPFMENNARWHAGKISDEDYKNAIERLQNAK